MAVNKKDKATTVSAASRTITADGVRIENGMFVDDEGNISGRVAEFLLNPTDSFKVTIKFELPDEEESTPDYEDYSVTNGTPSGWAISSQYPSFSKSYDPDTKEFVCSITVLWQNTSGAAKTVYGVKIRCNAYTRSSYGSTSGGGGSFFLACREHFAAPVVVEDQGIISLTFTWRVGRAGLVSATAASA